MASKKAPKKTVAKKAAKKVAAKKGAKKVAKVAKKAPARKAAKKVAKAPAKKAPKAAAKKAVKGGKKSLKKVAPGDVITPITVFAKDLGSLTNLTVLKAGKLDTCSPAGREMVKAANRKNGKVNEEHVLKRTEEMLLCRYNLRDLKPDAPLEIDVGGRGDLRGLIMEKGWWFDDVECEVSRDQLDKATTLRALVALIYKRCRLKF
ncbi:hypothetical protein [Luteolibacter luteus]|uniref:hypothetical protein n=1 Tax=Luteolibacter luteus TaxID=2728835 RepID=UPI00197B887E|nr:hypothetical protein [Luteolibacter luteus]